MTNHSTLKKILMIIFSLLCVFYIFKFHFGTKQNESQSAFYQDRIEKIHKSTNGYSNRQVENKLQRHEPNLQKAEASARQRVYHGTGLAYNKCQYYSGFNRNRAQISQALGTSFGNQVLSNVRPYSGKVSSTPISLAQHEQSIQIGFGRFNPMNDSLAMNVIVKFTSSKNANTKYNQNTYKHKSFTYYSSYQIAYKPKNSLRNQFIVEHFDCSTNSNQPYPSKF